MGVQTVYIYIYIYFLDLMAGFQDGPVRFVRLEMFVSVESFSRKKKRAISLHEVV